MPPLISRDEARQQRLQLFFDGAPCRKGHLAPRRVATGNCTECLRLRRRRSHRLERRRAEQQHDRYLRRLYLETRFRDPKERQAAYKRNYRIRRAIRQQEQERLDLERSERSASRTALRAIAAHLDSTHLLRNSLTYHRIGLTGPALRLWLETQWQPGMSWRNHDSRKPGHWSVQFRAPPQGRAGLDTKPGPMDYLNLVPGWNHLPLPPDALDPANFSFDQEATEAALLQEQSIARRQKRRARRRLSSSNQS